MRPPMTVVHTVKLEGAIGLQAGQDGKARSNGVVDCCRVRGESSWYKRGRPP